MGAEALVHAAMGNQKMKALYLCTDGYHLHKGIPSSQKQPKSNCELTYVTNMLPLKCIRILGFNMS